MTDACGFPRKRETRDRQARFRKTSAIITSSGVIPVSEIWFRATLLRAPQKKFATTDAASAPEARAFIWTFADAIRRMGESVVREKYGNLFDMYEEITGENAYKVPMRIYPAVHYTMGGLWVDYQLMSTIPGLVCRWRSQFFRSRREPPGRQRADARARGRIFHSALHDSQLHRLQFAGKGRYVASAVRRRHRGSESTDRHAAWYSRQANRRFVSQGTRKTHVGKLRNGAGPRTVCAAIWKGSRRCARNSGTT